MNKTLIAAACVASLSVPVNAAGVEDFFTSFYSLGDSLTDDGKFGLASEGGLLEPPSFEGRFTTGLTWSEYIEDAFTISGDDTRNYALGGATASDTNFLNPGPLATLAVGASDSTTFTGSYTITQADIDAGHFYNRAWASGSDPNGGDPITDDDDHYELRSPTS